MEAVGFFNGTFLIKERIREMENEMRWEVKIADVGWVAADFEWAVMFFVANLPVRLL